MIRRPLIFIALLLLFPALAFSETVYLKGGGKARGKIIEKNDNYIKIETAIGVITVERSTIEKIGAEEAADDIEKIQREIMAEHLRQYEPVEKNTTRKHKPAHTKTIRVKINPMIELDFKTRAEIYGIRKKYVSKHPELFEGSYEPSPQVFGAIKDKKPWWGILGISYYGNSQKSIEGKSEESRFIANPFLLVGLAEPYAYIVEDSKLKPKAIYPKATELLWRSDRSYARVKYRISDYFREGRRYRYKNVEEQKLVLIAYNARDLGFGHFYVVPERSKNVISVNKKKEAVLIKHFLHCGHSCGYPGGCNNMSPDMPEAEITIKSLPASAYIKLWRERPSDINQKHDMVFVIDMI